MKKLIISLLVVLPILSSLSALAQDSKILPGVYERDGGSGNLTIEVNEKNTLTFNIETSGGNCHTCSLTGVITGSTGHPDTDFKAVNESKCDIDFSVSGSTIVILPDDNIACRMYCGMRADFKGVYRIPPANCTRMGRELVHERFLNLYKAHHFTKAKDTLQKQMTQCEAFMDWIGLKLIKCGMT